MSHLRLVDSDCKQHAFVDLAALSAHARRAGVARHDVVFVEAESRWHLAGHVLRDHSGIEFHDRPVRETAETGERHNAASPMARPESASRTTLGIWNRVRNAERREKVVIAAALFLAAVVWFNYSSAPKANYSSVSTQASSAISVEPALPDQLSTVESGVVTNYGDGSAGSTGTSAAMYLALQGQGGQPFGYVQIAPPLGGSGDAFVGQRGNVIALVTANALGDTIYWVASVEQGRLTGSYFITGGSSKGQGGRWWVKVSQRSLETIRLHGEAISAENEAALRKISDRFGSFSLGSLPVR